MNTVDCPQCKWRHPVPNEYTDWRTVAETYEKMYRRNFDALWERIGEAGKQFDAPIQEYLLAEKQEILEALRSISEQIKNSQESGPSISFEP